MRLVMNPPDLPGYIFWHDEVRPFPYRWAAKTVPAAHDKHHGTHHGGATSQESAYDAAREHQQRAS